MLWFVGVQLTRLRALCQGTLTSECVGKNVKATVLQVTCTMQQSSRVLFLFACLKACFRLSLSTRNKKKRTVTRKKHAYRPEASNCVYYSLKEGIRVRYTVCNNKNKGSDVCVVCVVILFILEVRLVDVPAGVTQEEGHTGFLHLSSAVRALFFLARRIQPFLSLVDCEVEFCVLSSKSFSTCWAFFLWVCVWTEIRSHVPTSEGFKVTN